MATGIAIKAKDICDALDVKRHQLRLWTESFEPYCSRKTKERSANRYDFGDLLFFAVVQHIQSQLGVSNSHIANFSHSLYICLREPQQLVSSPFVFINMNDGRCLKQDQNKFDEEGLFVDLKPAQAKVYEFLGLPIPHQAQLQLGLVKVN